MSLVHKIINDDYEIKLITDPKPYTKDLERLDKLLSDEGKVTMSELNYTIVNFGATANYSHPAAILFHKGKVVGMCIFKLKSKNIYHITRFCVDVKHRGGNGTKLLEFTINHLKKIKAKQVSLNTLYPSPVNRLYERHGFKVDDIRSTLTTESIDKLTRNRSDLSCKVNLKKEDKESSVVDLEFYDETSLVTKMTLSIDGAWMSVILDDDLSRTDKYDLEYMLECIRLQAVEYGIVNIVYIESDMGHKELFNDLGTKAFTNRTLKF